MTLIDAINRIDAIKPNSFEQIEKIKWLSELDGKVKKEIIDTHEGADDVVFNGYDETTPLETELLIPSPYDPVYLLWLEAQIDYANNEYAKYNNSSVMYNNTYSAYWRYYNRTHMPLSKPRKYF
jgi:hypothetical protein